MPQLHQIFIEQAKRYPGKLAFIDRTTNRRITYEKALIGALILSGRFKSLRDGYLGIMLPTSAGCALSIIAALFSGKIPVMINYSTGAKDNVEYAKRKCDFETVITSRRLLEKINCPQVKGMVYIEDIMDDIKKTEKIKALLLSRCIQVVWMRNV